MQAYVGDVNTLTSSVAWAEFEKCVKGVHTLQPTGRVLWPWIGGGEVKAAIRDINS